MKKVLTFIMAGGKGERLSPLTKDRAKPAVPFGGVFRIIDFTLSNCINSGLRKVHVLTQYKSYSLTRHISRGWNVLNSELGEYIDAIPAQQRVDEHWYQGTADSIYQNIYAIEDENPDDVLVLAGDHVYKMDYRNMVDFHRQKDADLTVAVVEIPKEEASEFGVCEVDDNCRVKNIIEKPKTEKELTTDADNVFASMGIYIFKREVLQEVLLKNVQNKDSSHDFAKNIIPMMLKKYKVVIYNFKDEKTGKPMYWRDVGSLDAYYEANMELVDVVPPFNLYDKNWPFRTYQEQFGPTKTVFAGGRQDNRIGMVLDSLVSHGCIISGGKVERSILSPNVRINSFSEVTESVIMEGVDIGRYAKIRRTIIDKYVKVPANMEIGFNPEEDRKRFKVTESGIVVIPKNMVIK
ncbi:MAG: glucose-1-phosphate adenylyltransferase [Candidatus Omnitrophica bacterium]|nr:glucose-1-phosphate adenylyltransferase [Candidatus Omnitrophota bacterium]MBU1933449.1 glucose-1-phosphate adenylyltransferase [Candidatus Omnitrophota bacterium]